METLMTFEQLQKVGETYGLNVIEMNDEELVRLDTDRDFWVNASSHCGNEVHIGFYDDYEKRIISFFHEVGHHLTKRPEHLVSPAGPDFKVAPELVAWMLGLREAAKHGIHFSANTLDWALNQALSYRNYS